MVVVDEALAWHTTWTTYGSRLPGDERGYVSNTFIPGHGYVRKQNQFGTPYTADSEATRKRARLLQKWNAVYLNADEALVVAKALVDAAKRRGWLILRAAIMADHTHVVTINGPDDGPAIRRILKGNAYSALAGHFGKPKRVWSAGGSDRRKLGTQAVEDAVTYVGDQEYKLAEIIDMAARACIAK